MKSTHILLSAFAVFCLIGAGACKNAEVKEQTRQAGEAIKAAGKETGEAVTAAGDAAVAETKDAVEQAGGAIREGADQAKKDLSAAAERAGEKAVAAGDTAKQKIADATLTASIKAKLLADTEVKAVDINVDTVGGRVTLSGTAKTADQREAAERIARGTDGVLSVDNRIAVSNR